MDCIVLLIADLKDFVIDNTKRTLPQLNIQPKSGLLAIFDYVD